MGKILPYANGKFLVKCCDYFWQTVTIGQGENFDFCYCFVM